MNFAPAFAVSADSASNSCDCENAAAKTAVNQTAPSSGAPEKLLMDLKSIGVTTTEKKDQKEAPTIEASFVFELEKSGDGKWNEVPVPDKLLGLNEQSRERIEDIYDRLIDKAERGMTLDQALAYVSRLSGSLSIGERLYLLELLGGMARDSYNNRDYPLSDSPEHVWLAGTALAANSDSTDRAGICGAIADFLRHFQEALGFSSYEDSTLISYIKSNRDGSEGAHVVAIFADPESGELYLQDYNNLYRLNSRIFEQAVQEADQMASGYSASNMAETKPGHTVILRNNRSRWIDFLIEQELNPPKEGLSASARAGNKRVEGLLRFAKQIGDSKGSRFVAAAGYRNYTAPEGTYEVANVVIGAQGEKKHKIKNETLKAAIEDFSATVGGHVGLAHIKSPQPLSPNNSDPSETRETTRLQVGIDTGVRANLRDVPISSSITLKPEIFTTAEVLAHDIGKLEKTANVSWPFNEIVAGLKVSTSDGKSAVTLKESMQAVPYSPANLEPKDMRLARDSSVTVEHTIDLPELRFLKNGRLTFAAEGVALGGIQETQAIGDREDVSFSAQTLGEVNIHARYHTSDVHNQNGHAYYEGYERTHGVVFGISRENLFGISNLGAGIDYGLTNGKYEHSHFLSDDRITPERNTANDEQRVEGQVWYKW